MDDKRIRRGDDRRLLPVAPLPADDDRLFVDSVAAILDVHPKTVTHLPIRFKRVGRRRIYLGKWVREYLEGTAA